MARLPGSLSDRALTTPTLRHSLLAAEPVLEVYHALGGELIKGQIVVLSKILTEIEQGKTPYQAIQDGGTSKMRPVCMVVLTSVLGFDPAVEGPVFSGPWRCVSSSGWCVLPSWP